MVMNMAALVVKLKVKREAFAYRRPKKAPATVMTVKLQGFFKNS